MIWLTGRLRERGRKSNQCVVTEERRLEREKYERSNKGEG